METKSHNGETALLYAVRKGNRSIANAFSSEKADAFARDREGHLIQRKTEGFKTCGFLESHVIDFWQGGNFQENNAESTPLHLAAKRMNSRMVIDM